MKKINFSLFSIFLLLVSVVSVQTVFAGVPLKSDPTPKTTLPQSKVKSLSTTSVPLVTFSLDDSELVLDFSCSVGVAQITVEDQNGSVVYQDVIDTNSTLESVIETSGWDSGNYTVHIAYSSKKLVGTFQL